MAIRFFTNEWFPSNYKHPDAATPDDQPADAPPEGSVWGPSKELNCLILKKHWPWTADMTGARSHFGGLPMLPEHIEWPRVDHIRLEGVENHPMHFLAQIDCAELPDFVGRAQFPADGMLFFFTLLHEEFGAEFEGQPAVSCVIYVPVKECTLERRQPPPDIQASEQRSSCRYLSKLPEEDDCERAYHLGGFVPISFVPAPSSRDPDSNSMIQVTWDDVLMSRQTREAIYNKALGVNRVSETLHGKSFTLETVLQTRTVLWRLYEFYTWSINKLQKEDSNFSEQILTSTRRLNDVTNMQSALAGLPPQAATPVDVRTLATELWIDVERADTAGFSAALRLARCFPIETLPFTEENLERLRDFARGRVYNENMLLGLPSEVQYNSRACALDRGRELGLFDKHVVEDDLLLLLQLDTCYGGADWVFCDCGKVYFYIHRDDLAAVRFERAVMITEGG